MAAAAAGLIGRHDFAAFRSTNSDRSNTECLVRRAEILKLAEGQLEFWIAADHFVYNMVRIIVGTLIEIGLSKRTPESLSDALIQGDRDLAGPTAPAWGLTLNAVQYPEIYNLFEPSSRTGRAVQEKDREHFFVRKPRRLPGSGSSSMPTARRLDGYQPKSRVCFCGKTKLEFTPHVDCGDFVIIAVPCRENCSDSGRKRRKVLHCRHSGFRAVLKKSLWRLSDSVARLPFSNAQSAA